MWPLIWGREGHLDLLFENKQNVWTVTGPILSMYVLVDSPAPIYSSTVEYNFYLIPGV